MSHIMRAVPDNFIQTVDCVMDGLCRVLHGKPMNNGGFGSHESFRMMAGIDLEVYSYENFKFIMHIQLTFIHWLAVVVVAE